MTLRRCSAPFAAIMFVASALSAQSAHPITPDALRRELLAFSDDSMQGRATGTRGNARAVEYLARELARAGIKRAGEEDTYFQKVPILRLHVDVKGARVSAGNGVTGAPAAAGATAAALELKPGVDFVPIAGHFGAPFAIKAVPDPNADKWHQTQFFLTRGALDDLVNPDSLLPHDTPSDTAWLSQVSFVLKPPHREDGQPDYQIWNALQFVEQYRGACALFIESLDFTPRSVLASLAQPGFVLGPDPRPRPPTVKVPGDMPAVIAVSSAAASLLHLAPAAFIVHGPGQNADVRFSWSTSALPAPTRNVLAMVEGGDRSSEVVVLSAHADHLGIAPRENRIGSDSIMNGADVSGTGSVALLEIAQYMKSLPRRPSRTIVFLWTVGGEQGGLGAQWFVERPSPWLGTVVANIDIDAIGRGGAADIEDGGPAYVEILGANQLSAEYARWGREVVGRPELGLHPGNYIETSGPSPKSFCVGDGWRFTHAGVPSVLVTTGEHPDFRAVTDSPDRIDYDKFARVTRFVAALALDIANRPDRPRVDSTTRRVQPPCR